MADNFTADPGALGDTFGADDIGGVKFPRSKIIIGADGTNDGDVSSAIPLPSILSENSGVDIGDVDVTSQPALVATTDGVGVSLDTTSIMSGTTALTPKYAVISGATSGNNTLVAAVASKKIRVLSRNIFWEHGHLIFKH